MVSDESVKYEWIPSSNGRMHDGAIEGGFTSTGEKLYIGRIRHDRVMTCGKIHPSNGGLFIAYGSNEHSYQHGYEILVSNGFRQPRFIAQPPRKDCIFCRNPRASEMGEKCFFCNQIKE